MSQALNVDTIAVPAAAIVDGTDQLDEASPEVEELLVEEVSIDGMCGVY
ncbi:mycofactocin precursor MftA [Jatrophihabitans sp. DSM 45814]